MPIDGGGRSLHVLCFLFNGACTCSAVKKIKFLLLNAMHTHIHAMLNLPLAASKTSLEDALSKKEYVSCNSLRISL